MEWIDIFWFALIVIFVMTELNTVTMVSIWFVFGALGALIVSFLGGELWLQITVFIIVSFLLLLSLRPLTKKYITPRMTRTNVDSVLGTQGPVLEAIDNVASTGRVKLGSLQWSARSTNGEPIEEGCLVKVDRIEGVKVFVTKV